MNIFDLKDPMIHKIGNISDSFTIMEIGDIYFLRFAKSGTRNSGYPFVWEFHNIYHGQSIK